MRWKIKQQEWVEGSIRKRYRFAWFPTKVGNVMVWLERYVVKEQLECATVINEGFTCRELRWTEISRDTLDYYYG